MTCRSTRTGRSRTTVVAPGADGESLTRVTATPGTLVSWMDAVQRKLKDTTCRPMLVRCVHIPMSNGGQRPLGIPTVKDRVRWRRWRKHTKRRWLWTDYPDERLPGPCGLWRLLEWAAWKGRQGGEPYALG